MIAAMYHVIVVSSSERVIYSGLDGYVALDISKRYRNKTKFPVVLESPSGKRYSMSEQNIMMRRLKI